MFLSFKPRNFKYLIALLLCTLLVTPSFSIADHGSASIDRYRMALKVDPDNLTLHYNSVRLKTTSWQRNSSRLL